MERFLKASFPNSFTRFVFLHPLAEANISSSSHLEDNRLIARARAVGVDYEFAKRGEMKMEEDRRKTQRQN